jgi:acyl-CoA synthetase (AMP-forming)/AMP-acid ligase II
MFRTGDFGYQDSDGYCYILDRLKDMIVTGGENATPRRG